MAQEYIPTVTVARILCCECGIGIEPNSANMCIDCLRSRVDITEGIPKQIVVNFCRGCERYLQPPAQWLLCALESKELLALLLKRIKGVGGKVRLVDAGFIWTEPHSKRLKVKLTVQKEAFAATILQQTFVVEAVVANQQCPDCARREAKNTWNTVVQVRQKAAHKRTFLYLEQLILKHQAHRDTVNIRPVKDGIDFFFGSRSAAIRFIDFLTAVVPARSKASEQLLTSDTQSGDSTYKFTFSVEIIPVCKDDLLCLPQKLCRALGGIEPMMICIRVGTSLHLLCPRSLQTVDIINSAYWREPFSTLMSQRDLVEFVVIDLEPVQVSSSNKSLGGAFEDNLSIRGGNYSTKKHSLVDVVIAKASEFGRTSTTFTVRSHLGHLLHVGDVALGYDLTNANLNDEAYSQLLDSERSNIPEVILVRKSYAHLRRELSAAGRNQRKWALRSLPMEVEPGVVVDTDTGVATQRDYERFFEEIEEDAEMRAHINLYRVSTANNGESNDSTDGNMMVDEADQFNDSVPQVPLEELLDDLCLADDN